MMLKKISYTVLLVTCIVLLIAYGGRKTIMASPVYGLAQLEVQKRYGVTASDLQMRLLRPFKFSEGAFSADAEFVLCNSEDACYGVKADKAPGDWQIVDIKKK